jgi:hypothetical protein
MKALFILFCFQMPLLLGTKKQDTTSIEPIYFVDDRPDSITFVRVEYDPWVTKYTKGFSYVDYTTDEVGPMCEELIEFVHDPWMGGCHWMIRVSYLAHPDWEPIFSATDDHWIDHTLGKTLNYGGSFWKPTHGHFSGMWESVPESCLETYNRINKKK